MKHIKTYQGQWCNSRCDHQRDCKHAEHFDNLKISAAYTSISHSNTTNMKKALKIETTIYHIKDGVRIEGAPEGVTGNLSNIRGDLSGVTGNLSGITGDLYGIRGNLTGITGNLTGISGDIDDCEITDEERAKGVHIEQLIAD